MKKAVILLIVLIILTLVWLRINIFTTPDIRYAQECEWMYEKGWQVKGDFLSFEKNDMHKDTIYQNKQAVAIIKRTYPAQYMMILESTDKKEVGMYREIGAHLKDEHIGMYDGLILVLLDIIY
jgi:hypothetical protein